VFFCKYNDPLYVKLEKIEILVLVAEDRNAEAILNELKDYSNDMDMDLVTASVKAIGQIILKVNRSLQIAVRIVAEIIENGQPVALNSAIIIAKDIFRRFPNKYEKIIPVIIEKREHYTEPEAKAAINWIVGEHADKIKKVEEILTEHIDMFLEEPINVQLAILTATVKLYLKKPDNSEEMIKKVLDIATEESESPDLKDRGYIYWRMLSISPAKTEEVVLSKKPNIAHDCYNIYDDEFLTKLCDQISNLSSVYHRTADAWNNHLRKFDKNLPANSGIPSDDKEDVKEEVEEPRKKEKKKKPVKKEISSSEEDEMSEEDVKEKKPRKKVKPAPVKEPEAEVDMLDLGN
jgi:AP-1 complex subunit beta-1